MNKVNKIIIPLPLMTLNEYTNTNRGNRYAGASSKKKATGICAVYTKQAMNKGFELGGFPADFEFHWYAKDRRTDKDNLAFQRKFIFDGFQDAGLIKNDNWATIGDWKDTFYLDKENPRVEIMQLN